MKTNIPFKWFETFLKSPRLRPEKRQSNSTHYAILVAGALLAGQAAPADGWDNNYRGNIMQVGSVFIIAMENHNFTQPNPTSNPQQIFGNPAAPYINSLLTPGNPNAAQVSYCTAYYNAGTGVHPSEPSYVWAEAGTDFGFHSDAEPASANGNAFYDNTATIVSQLNAFSGANTVSFWHFNYTAHLTAQLDAAGIPWRNYQEDIELTASPRKNASGTTGPVNPYYGTTQFNYAAKHNPMAFFAQSAFENLYPLAQLFDDLNNNTVGKYNWITPNQYNDQHSALSGGFTYQDVAYTGDQSAIAVGDNFLATVIPQIMASKAYQNNGVIIIWWDETEGGDGLDRTIPEIIISPLAKGNAYASSVPMSHSSDIKTVEEILGLPLISNPIPAAETNNFNGYNNVALVNDLSDLFVPGAIPSAPNIKVSAGSFMSIGTNHQVIQLVQITNNGSTPVAAPLELALDGLNSDVKLLNADGTTAILAPTGSPFVYVPLGRDNVITSYETRTVKLKFFNPNGETISYTARVLNVTPAP
jgi:phosphatidylinositol-3-phosphatase